MSTWKKYKLREICSEIIDCVNKTAPISDTPTQYKMLRTSDVRGGFINLENLNCVSEETFEKWSRRGKLQKGDVILTREAPLGEVGLVRQADNYFLGQRLVLYRANPNLCDGRFMMYALLYDENKQAIVGKGNGATVHHLRIPDCETIEIKAPDLPTQKRIADILSAYDDLIENNQRQIKLLEEAAMRLYREWFVFMRFPGHESVRIVDGVPEGWEVKQINDVCLNCASGGTPSRKRREYWADGSVNWFKTQELVDSWLFDADEKISEKGLENSSAKLFPENTIVMAIYASPTLGRLGILTKESTFNQAALGLVANGDFVSYEWLYLKLFELRDKFNAIASGAGQQNINVKIVQTKEIVVPSHDVMGKFTEIIHPYFEKQKNLTEQIIYLQKARDALLPRLMNGGEGLKLEGGAV